MSSAKNEDVVVAKPTDAEMKMIVMVLANQKSKPDVDWKTLAPLLGYSTVASAQTRWGQIGKRLGFRSSTSSSSANSTPRKPSTANTNGTPSKSGNMSSVPSSPSKAKVNGKKSGGGVIKNGRGGGAKGAKKVKQEIMDDEENDGEKESGIENEHAGMGMSLAMEMLAEESDQDA